MYNIIKKCGKGECDDKKRTKTSWKRRKACRHNDSISSHSNGNRNPTDTKISQHASGRKGESPSAPSLYRIEEEISMKLETKQNLTIALLGISIILSIINLLK